MLLWLAVMLLRSYSEADQKQLTSYSQALLAIILPPADQLDIDMALTWEHSTGLALPASQVYAAVALLAAVYVAAALPETKGRPLAEVQVRE